ncbi:MAG: hypothetical protein O2779_00060 [Nanoarchaeota archaeon]|nr:hypothetical protein [Nanoarchaeota archaeon]
MNGAENIKKEMLEEAQQEVEKIQKEVAEKIDVLKKEHGSIRDAYETQRKHEIARAAALLTDKTLARTRLQVKRNYLIEREKVVESIVKSASKVSHSDKVYQNYLKALVNEHVGSLKGKITIHCNSKDVSYVSGLVDGIAVEEADIDGGIIVENDAGKKINESFLESIERRMDMVREVVVKHLGK